MKCYRCCMNVTRPSAKKHSAASTNADPFERLLARADQRFGAPGVERPPVTLTDLSIRTKDKRLVSFAPNEVQTLYLDLLTETYPGFDWRQQRYTLRGAREDILKARQEGMSTLWLALYFLDTINTPLTQTLLIAHDVESTERLFQVVKRFYEHLPVEKKRPTRYSSRRELHFADIDSVIYVGTAGSGRVGRGGTISNCHMSECAYWERGPEVEAGLLEAIPMDGNATRETTANGLNAYYEEYQRSKRNESRFRARFFGWNLQGEYQVADHGLQLADLSEEEAGLEHAYGLSLGQLAWRREKIKDLKEKFPQEYPINDVEAFLASGNPRFNREYLYQLLASLQAAPEPLRIETPERSEWNGTLTTYVEPEETRKYLITADVSEGLNQYGKHDFSVAHVYDRETWEQVAHYVSGMAEPHDYALDLDLLGRLYNTATIAVERNNHGHSVLNTLQNVCRYPAIHCHQYFDEIQKKELPKAGFPSTTRSKPEAVADLAGLIDDMSAGEAGFIWNCPSTVEQLIHYIKVAGGKTAAESGSNDDEVTCCWIAAALMPQYLMKARPIQRPLGPPKLRYGGARPRKRR